MSGGSETAWQKFFLNFKTIRPYINTLGIFVLVNLIVLPLILIKYITNLLKSNFIIDFTKLAIL